MASFVGLLPVLAACHILLVVYWRIKWLIDWLYLPRPVIHLVTRYLYNIYNVHATVLCRKSVIFYKLCILQQCLLTILQSQPAVHTVYSLLHGLMDNGICLCVCVCVCVWKLSTKYRLKNVVYVDYTADTLHHHILTLTVHIVKKRWMFNLYSCHRHTSCILKNKWWWWWWWWWCDDDDDADADGGDPGIAVHSVCYPCRILYNGRCTYVKVRYCVASVCVVWYHDWSVQVVMWMLLTSHICYLSTTLQLVVIVTCFTWSV